MARTCTVCLHPKLDEINAALIRSDTLRNIAENSGTSITALHRHKAEHLPVSLLKAAEAKEIQAGGTLMEQLIALHRSTLEILETAKAAGSLETALKAISQARGNLELLAKLEGALASGGNVVNNNGPVSIEVTYVQSGAIPARHPQSLDAAQLVLDASAIEVAQ